MPSIEIVCVKQNKCSRFLKLPFAIRSEDKLESYRSEPLFKKDFDKLNGCIYHLGCPHTKYKRNGFFEAYDLLSINCQRQEETIFLEFKNKYISDIRRILKTLLEKSPEEKILFTSDYQFSDNKPKRIMNLSLKQFWDLHKNKTLLFNTLYEINNLIKAQQAPQRRPPF